MACASASSRSASALDWARCWSAVCCASASIWTAWAWCSSAVSPPAARLRLPWLRLLRRLRRLLSLEQLLPGLSQLLLGLR